MTLQSRTRMAATVAVAALLVLESSALIGQQQPPQGEGFRFRSGIELINVTAAVIDGNGRFVPGLRKEDFRVYEDGELQTISHFSNERVPVSLGIVLDTSASMAGDKWAAALAALDRFIFELLDQEDEIFIYRFSGDPELAQDWTTDRHALRRSLNRMVPAGGTAMYDAVAEALPLAQAGKHRKKALLIVSDGNDTSSRTPIMDVKQLVRESETLVYAIGIDGQGEPTFSPPGQQPPTPRFPPPTPFPFPVPGGRRPPPMPFPQPPSGGSGGGSRSRGDRLNVAALREITDDSGGRTEIIRSGRDLDPATANVADELSRQYYLGYPSPGKKDGRWHAIRVEVRDPSLRVRARRGYVAS
jgi:Ca-activated chloride channel family protein